MSDSMINPRFAKAFVSQTIFSQPIGGILVAESYTKILRERGHNVKMVMPKRLEVPLTVSDRARALIAFSLEKIRFKKQRPDSPYIQLTPWISKHFTPDLFDGTTLAIANGHPTMLFLNKEIFKKFGGYSFIQGHETWMGTENEIFDAWKIPVKKAAISKWLQQLVMSTGEHCDLIPNGIDLGVFNVKNQIERRNPYRLGMLWHQHHLKGMPYLLASLERLHQQIPQLEVIAFGAVRPTSPIPSYIKFEFQPTKNRLASIYNSCSIFVAPSLSEGFGLTPAEAMACGCAVVATNIGGHQEFCCHAENSILVPPSDSEMIFQGVLAFVNSEELRFKIAHNGAKTLCGFDLNRSADLMESFLDFKREI